MCHTYGLLSTVSHLDSLVVIWLSLTEYFILCIQSNITNYITLGHFLSISSFLFRRSLISASYNRRRTFILISIGVKIYITDNEFLERYLHNIIVLFPVLVIDIFCFFFYNNLARYSIRSVWLGLLFVIWAWHFLLHLLQDFKFGNNCLTSKRSVKINVWLSVSEKKMIMKLTA